MPYQLSLWKQPESETIQMKAVEQIFYLVLFYYVVHISYYPTVLVTEYKYPTILYSWLLYTWLLYSTVRALILLHL